MATFSGYDVMTLAWSKFKNTAAYFTNTGYTSREFLSIAQTETKFFPCVGGMGYVSSVAFSYAYFSQNKTVCFDGDGSLLMHLGSLANVLNKKTTPFIHVLLNNQKHRSVGGFEIAAAGVNFYKIAKNMGYAVSIKASSLDEINSIFDDFSLYPQTTFIQIEVNDLAVKNLPRIKNFAKLINNFYAKN